MYNYIATFVPGFQDSIKETLQKEVADITIIHLHEASITFSTAEPYTTLLKKKYFTNVFILASHTQISEQTADGSLVKSLAKQANIQDCLPETSKPLNTFRIMVQKGSKLVHIPKDIQKKIIRSVSEQTGLEFSPLKADVELWFMLRTEGFAYCAIKLPGLAQDAFANVYSPVKGELRPHLAHLLNLLSDPQPTDIYLDQFAGYGALPFDRAVSFPYAHIYAFDNDSALTVPLKRKMENFKNMTVALADALHLTKFEDGSIDKIVTDPPWGFFTMQDINFLEFYKNMLTEINRVLKKEGIAIILTARKEEFISALQQAKVLTEISQISTLVNGKKATVFKLQK